MNLSSSSVVKAAKRLPLWARIWGGVGALLALALVLLWVAQSVSGGGGFGCLFILATLLFLLWGIPTFTWLLIWLWIRLTCRVRGRLRISYLLIGIFPIPLILALLAGGGYVLVGQYTSGALGDLKLQVGHGLNQWTELALGSDAAGPLDLPADMSALEPRVHWLLATGGVLTAHSEESSLEVPNWVSEGKTEGHFLTSAGPILASIEKRNGRIAAAWIPLDAESSRAISRERWFEARFLEEPVLINDGQDTFDMRPVGTDGEAADDEWTPEEDSGELFETELIGDGWWKKRWIFFVHLSPEPRAWVDGELLEKQSLPTLVMTSPSEGVASLFSSPYRIGPALGGALLFLGALGSMIYLVALMLATVMMVSITRSTARLTRGARQVESGDLDYRIAVRRRDQLGDLAVAFNEMTESVQSMLVDVADKERMKKEFELVREIQQSLLPEATFEHGSIVVRAHFQPADEVGGDYFDVFPLEEGRLIVTVGDVAGHGLPTGLLMAMLKSAVATLVREGHRGTELLERLNALMLEQPREHRMVTLAVAEIDTRSGFVTLTNAAHPPPFLIGEGVREVLLPALPIGFPWAQPPPSTKLDLAPDARLVFYSDGLVEALDSGDEPFGYDRLQRLLSENLELPTEALLGELLRQLSLHTGKRPLDDDLTVLMIDCGSSTSDLRLRRSRRPPRKRRVRKEPLGSS